MAGKRGQYAAYDGDQVAKWKDEPAKRRRQQRRQRGRRTVQHVAQFRPGMGRLTTAPGDGDGHQSPADRPPSRTVTGTHPGPPDHPGGRPATPERIALTCVNSPCDPGLEKIFYGAKMGGLLSVTKGLHAA